MYSIEKIHHLIMQCQGRHVHNEREEMHRDIFGKGGTRVEHTRFTFPSMSNRTCFSHDKKQKKSVLPCEISDMTTNLNRG